jgi:hypothetical protein
MLIARVGLEIANSAQKEDPKGGDNRLCVVQVDDRGRVAASDGHHWLRMDALVREPDLFLADRLADLQPLRAESAMLASDVVKDFNGACKLSRAEQVVLCTDDVGTPTLCTIDGKATRTFLVTKREQLPFDFDKLSRHDGQPVLSVTLSIDLLRRMLKTLSALGAETVKMTYWDWQSVIDIRAISLDPVTMGAVIDGGLMPMRDPDATVQSAKLPTNDPPPAPATPLLDNADQEANDQTAVELRSADGTVLFSGSTADLRDAKNNPTVLKAVREALGRDFKSAQAGEGGE